MNLVLISLDSLRADALGCYGNRKAQTPFLDDLARRGARFQAITQAPFTIPSHASIFTGLYPHHHRLREQHGQKIDPRALTLFTRLNNVGYQSGSLMSARPFGPEHGYADLNVLGPCTLARFAQLVDSWRGNKFFIFLHYWDVHVPYRVHLRPRTREQWLSELALRLEDTFGVTLPPRYRDEWLPTGGVKWGNRVFAVRDLMATHQPAAREQVLAGYARSVKVADRFVGGVARILERAGVGDETLLAVMADHGESFDEHGELAERPDNYFHGHHLYDTLLRVPLILYGPGIPQGFAPAEPVQLVDVAPTACDLMDIPPASQALPFDGVSLRAFMAGGTPPHDAALTEIWRADHNCHQVSYRTPQSKLIVDFDAPREMLFDLQADPGETRDESQAQPERVREYRARLARIWQPDNQSAAAMTAEEEAAVVARLTALGYI